MTGLIRTLIIAAALAAAQASACWGAQTIRIAVQKTGTFAWELAIIRAHGLDKQADLALQVQELASPEAGKIALSTADQTVLDLERLRNPEQLRLQRSDFDAAVDHLVQTVEQTVLALLKQAGLRADDIDSVFFTGGSSGVRLLRERIAALAPKARHVEGDLFGSIGSGLAIDAARKFG